MAKTPINLGRSPSEYYGGGAMPSPMSMSDAEKVIYPSFHNSGDEELDLPEEGTMVIKYKVTREVSEVREGKHHYECDIQVREIVSVKGEKSEAPAQSHDEAGDALDKIKEEMEEKDEEGEGY